VTSDRSIRSKPSHATSAAAGVVATSATASLDAALVPGVFDDLYVVADLLVAESLALDGRSDDGHVIAVVARGGDAGGPFAGDEVVAAGEPGEHRWRREPHRSEVVRVQIRVSRSSLACSVMCSSRSIHLPNAS